MTTSRSHSSRWNRESRRKLELEGKVEIVQQRSKTTPLQMRHADVHEILQGFGFFESYRPNQG